MSEGPGASVGSPGRGNSRQHVLVPRQQQDRAGPSLMIPSLMILSLIREQGFQNVMEAVGADHRC